MELAEKDGNVFHLLADSGTGYDEMFSKFFPKQILNFGICEANMVAAAAGMASVGKIPFLFTSGAFLAYRAVEFIRNDICLQNMNVKVVGMGSGLSWSSLGPTHHTTEDISMLRAIPNLVILSPATPIQVSQCVQKAYEYMGPVYIRIGMNGEKEFYDESYQVEIGKNDILMDGEDATVLVTGSILEEAYEVCKNLEGEGIKIRLINVSSLKPFGHENIIDVAGKAPIIFVIEEHNIHGGLASIVSEIVAFQGLGIKVVPIGINDMFAKGYGTNRIVRKVNGLDVQSICRRIREELKKE